MTRDIPPYILWCDALNCCTCMGVAWTRSPTGFGATSDEFAHRCSPLCPRHAVPRLSPKSTWSVRHGVSLGHPTKTPPYVTAPSLGHYSASTTHELQSRRAPPIAGLPALRLGPMPLRFDVWRCATHAVP